ncbi:MAG: hypothetical protein KF832_25180 [Caldilineaceae bacterium]|nr:hypothetical protein [Caldilineaceae bacterium]
MTDAAEAQLVAEIARQLQTELPELLKRTVGGYKILIHILPGHKEAKIEFQPRIITIKQGCKK